MSWPTTGMLRMPNLFGPDAMDQSYQPDETVQAQVGPPPEEVHAQVGGPTMPPLFPTPMSQRPPNIPTSIQQPEPDEYATAYQEEQPSALDEFRKSVLAGPPHTPMEYPKSTLNTLDSALKVAAERTPYEQNRVYVNGNPYQQVHVAKDAAGNKIYINKYKQPSFGEQVLRSMAGGAPGQTAADILNQPGKEASADYVQHNKDLQALAQAESQTQQRAQSGSALLQNANTRAYLASLKDLPESERIARLQDGRMTLAEYNASAALKRVETQQTGATTRTGMQQEGATTRTGMQQEGATSRTQMQIDAGQALEKAKQTGRIALKDLDILGDKELEEIKRDDRIQVVGAEGDQARQTAILKAQEARKTKAAPSGTSDATSKLPSQQIRSKQIKSDEILTAHPEWRQYVTIDPDTKLPTITPPKTGLFGKGPDQDTYDQIKAAFNPPSDTNLPAPNTPAPTPASTPAPIKAPAQAPAPDETSTATSVKTNAPIYDPKVKPTIPEVPALAGGPQPRYYRKFDDKAGKWVFQISYDNGATIKDYYPYGK